jgi:hypothetical protein
LSIPMSCKVLMRCTIGRAISTVHNHLKFVGVPQQKLANGSLIDVLLYPSAWADNLRANYLNFDLTCPAGKAVCCQTFDIRISDSELLWHPDAVEWTPLSFTVHSMCEVEHALARSPVPTILREKAWWLNELNPFTGDITAGNRAEFLSHLYELASDSNVRTYCEVCIQHACLCGWAHPGAWRERRACAVCGRRALVCALAFLYRCARMRAHACYLLARL